MSADFPDDVNIISPCVRKPVSSDGNQPACVMCMEPLLGCEGGPVSLQCGHNFCFECLRKLQKSQPQPGCPLCRSPIDRSTILGPNIELREALEKAALAQAELTNLRSSTIFIQQELSKSPEGTQHSLSFKARESNSGLGQQERCHQTVPLAPTGSSSTGSRGLMMAPPGSSRPLGICSSDSDDESIQGAVSYDDHASGSVAAALPVSHLYSISDEEDEEDGYNRARAAGRRGELIAASGQSEVNVWRAMAGALALITGQVAPRNWASTVGRTRRTVSHRALQGAIYADGNALVGSQNDLFNSMTGGPDQGAAVYIWNHLEHQPSAPPLLAGAEGDFRMLREVLQRGPIPWVPDSHSSSCMQCGALFRLTCLRHHCRFCGLLFCHACSRQRCLLPVRFCQSNPQRVCDACYDQLLPVQRVLVTTVSNAAQLALHDVTDGSSPRGWVNNPLGTTMQEEIYKATNTLRKYSSQIGMISRERSIPGTILRGAVGLAIITVAKVGMVVTYKLGTGLVVARRPDGVWSAPSAICTGGLGWGPQVGGELTDLIIVLSSLSAVKAFCGLGHMSLGAGLSAAVGPIGRAAELDFRAGDKGAATCYTYSCSKGAFVGISIEANTVVTRSAANALFYGDPSLTAGDILLGLLPQPKAAMPLYQSLQDLLNFASGGV